MIDPSETMPPPDEAALRDTSVSWVMVLALAAAYFLAARLGLTMAFAAKQVTAVWPPTGIALAALLTFGYRLWPGIALGAFLVNATASASVGTALGIATGNTLEAVIGAWALRHFIRFDRSVERLEDVLGLVFLAALVSTTVSATMGVASLCMGGIGPWSEARSLWWVWWLGDANGDLVMAPLLLTWTARHREPWPARRLGEAATLVVTLVLLTLTVFHGFFRLEMASSLPYVVFPFIIWAALRFGPPGTTLVTFIASGIAIWGTVSHLGPFAKDTVHESLNLLQLFMMVAAVTGLLLRASVAERRQAEEALKENDRRKDEFLAMLAHELRNPLAAISNAVQLKGRAASREDAEWSQDVIVTQVRNLARMIDDLLDVSRITRGKIQVQKHALDLRDLIHSAVETVKPLIAQREHQLNVQLASEPLWVLGDPTRLEQAIVNLLNNAAKYTEASGRITLAARSEDENVVLTVEDNGIGISAELLPRIFELFAQGDRSIARTEGGLGIGLTLVKSLVELHGGSIRATSAGAGQGSQFVVRLPRAKERPAAVLKRNGAMPHAVGKPSRVLVVDDNEPTARGMARLLTRIGHTVEITGDGPSAIDLARSFRPEFILLDIGLPGMDGYQVARKLRETGPSDTVIIAVSGYGEAQAVARSREAGFDHHLVKPVDVDSLAALIGRKI